MTGRPSEGARSEEHHLVTSKSTSKLQNHAVWAKEKIVMDDELHDLHERVKVLRTQTTNLRGECRSVIELHNQRRFSLIELVKSRDELLEHTLEVHGNLERNNSRAGNV